MLTMDIHVFFVFGFGERKLNETNRCISHVFKCLFQAYNISFKSVLIQQYALSMLLAIIHTFTFLA